MHVSWKHTFFIENLFFISWWTFSRPRRQKYSITSKILYSAVFVGLSTSNTAFSYNFRKYPSHIGVVCSIWVVHDINIEGKSGEPVKTKSYTGQCGFWIRSSITFSCFCDKYFQNSGNGLQVLRLTYSFFLQIFVKCCLRHLCHTFDVLQFLLI